MLEIYNETITDLLNPSSQHLQIREDVRGQASSSSSTFVEDLRQEVVNSPYEALNCLKVGIKNRTTGATSMNQESSRSHSVFTLYIESREAKNATTTIRYSRLNLVDLAGSERQKSTEASGIRLKEAGAINKSLSALGNVIHSLVDIANGLPRHVHYRDSKLTFLLKVLFTLRFLIIQRILLEAIVKLPL